MTLENLMQSDLWRDFEQQVRARRKQPAKVLEAATRGVGAYRKPLQLQGFSLHGHRPTSGMSCS